MVNKPATDKKVFDVAKPEASRPETGTKPMVIGHRSLASDPTLRAKLDGEAVSAQDSTEDKTTVPHASKIHITPLVEENTNNEETKSDSVAQTNGELNETEATTRTTNSNDESVKTKTTDETPKTSEPLPAKEQVEEQPEEKPTEVSEDKKLLEREEKLQELVQSREYAVSIKQASSFSVSVFLITLFVCLFIGIVVLVVLIDAELVDFGIELPFDLI